MKLERFFLLIIIDLYPNFEPVTAKEFRDLQAAVNIWLQILDDFQAGKAQDPFQNLADSIQASGYRLSRIKRERKEFDREQQVRQLAANTDADGTQTYDTISRPPHRSHFDILLEKLESVLTMCEEAAVQKYYGRSINVEGIRTALKETQDLIPKPASSPPSLGH